jgi:hypothetical protein
MAHSFAPPTSHHVFFDDATPSYNSSHSAPPSPHRPFPNTSGLLAVIGTFFYAIWSFVRDMVTSPISIRLLRTDVSFLLSENRALHEMLIYQGELLTRTRTAQLYLFEVVRTCCHTSYRSDSDDDVTPHGHYGASPNNSIIYYNAEQIAETVIHQADSLVPPPYLFRSSGCSTLHQVHSDILVESMV